jgi:hypothetical protein
MIKDLLFPEKYDAQMGPLCLSLAVGVSGNGHQNVWILALSINDDS